MNDMCVAEVSKVDIGKIKVVGPSLRSPPFLHLVSQISQTTARRLLSWSAGDSRDLLS